MEKALENLERTVRSSQTVMNIKDVADVLGVTAEALKKHIRQLWPDKLQNGRMTYLTEEEVTVIKKRMIPTTAVVAAQTQLEENETIAKAMMILQQRSEEYRLRAERAEHTNAILMHCSKLYTATEIAKELGYRSANELNKELELRGLQYKVNGTWVPTAKYADRGFFEIKQEVHDDTGYVYYDRKITQEGRRYILELLA